MPFGGYLPENKCYENVFFFVAGPLQYKVFVQALFNVVEFVFLRNKEPSRIECGVIAVSITHNASYVSFFCNSYKTALSRVRYAYTSWSNNEYRESITCNMELQIITLCKKGVVIIFFRPGTLDIFRSTHSCISRMQNCTNCTKNRIYKLMAKNSENAFNSRGYFQREAG